MRKNRSYVFGCGLAVVGAAWGVWAQGNSAKSTQGASETIDNPAEADKKENAIYLWARTLRPWVKAS